jgi:ribonuclease E
MAVVVEEADAAPAVAGEAPKRRRVRRKVSASATAESATGATSTVEPNEIESAGEPVELDVFPAEAVEPAAVEPEPAPVAAPAPAPEPEIDVAALIAEDPNQIVAPPEKPKRGWWRR